MYVTTPVAKNYYSVSSDTLRRWADAGKISFILTKGNHRRYFVPDPVNEEDPSPKSSKFIYVRVSSYKQKSDLQLQRAYLSNLFPNHSVISDFGSGLNFRRKGFKTLLDKLFSHELSEVVVASKDRLARFGYELLEDIFSRNNAKIIVVNDSKRKNFDEELSEDILSIITYFTAKYSGHRKYRKVIKGDTSDSSDDESKTESDGDTESDVEPKKPVTKVKSSTTNTTKKVAVRASQKSNPTKSKVLKK